MTTHDPTPDTPLIKKLMRFYDTWLGRVSLCLYSKVIVTCSLEIPFLLSMGLSHSKIAFIPNGVEDCYFKIGGKTSAFRDIYSLKDAFLILQVVRVDYNKGIEFIIDSMPSILHVIPSARYIIVGPVTNLQFFQRLKAKIRAKGLEKYIIFIGPVDDVADAYAACDVFTYISVSQRPFSYGVSTLEAMAVGKSVVVSNTVLPSSIIVDNVSGFTIPFGDCKALTEVLYNLFKHESFKLQVGRNAKKAVSSLRWSNIVKAIERIYYNCLEKDTSDD